MRKRTNKLGQIARGVAWLALVPLLWLPVRAVSYWANLIVSPDMVILAKRMGDVEPEELVAAAREMLQQKQRYTKSPAKMSWSGNDQVHLYVGEDYSGTDIPAEVVALKPLSITIRDDRVLLGPVTGHRFQVVAFPRGTVGYGAEMLTKGLWYSSGPEYTPGDPRMRGDETGRRGAGECANYQIMRMKRQG